MPKVTHDLCAATRQYTSNDGKIKNQYVNVGGVMLMDDGREAIFINRSFNPAGCVFKNGSDHIFLARFEKKDKNATTLDPQPPVQQSRGADGIEDQDIPF